MYPIKILTEDIRETMVFKPELKAKLRTEYAQKRINELEKIMGKKDIDPQKIEAVRIKITKPKFLFHSSFSATSAAF